MLNIPNIVLHALLHILYILSLTTTSIHLCPTRNTRAAKMSYHIVSYQRGVHLCMVEHMRTGAYQTHVTLEHMLYCYKFITAIHSTLG